MDHDPRPADAAHAMTTALRYHQRAGRFGRYAQAPHEAEMCEPEPQHSKSFEVEGYVVDADAVACAIVARLLAGRAIRVGTRPRSS
jgi:hypothetical protein